MPKKLLLLFLLIGLFACKRELTPNAVVPVSLINANKNKILFLSLETTKANNSLKFSVLDQKMVDGKLKRGMPSSLDTDTHLIFEFQSADGRTMTTVAVENPLDRSVEVSDESGKFERKQISLDTATLVLRIQFRKQMTRLKVSDANGNELAILPLTQ